MTGDRSDYVINVERLPGGENASRFDGHEHGASVSFFISRNRPGTGPDLHRHPYEETFIVQDGKARFTVGEETIEALAGGIVVVPAGTPHKFVYELTGPRLLTFKEAVGEIARAAGREIRFVPICVEEYASVLAEQDVPVEFVTQLTYLFGEVLDGRNAYLTDGVRRALGREPRPFAHYAREAAATGVWDGGR